MEFSLPLPPSVNACFATDFRSRRRFATKPYADWKKAAGERLMQQYAAMGAPSIHKPLAVAIRLGMNYRGDVDGRIKPLLDLLVANLDMPDDRWIERIVAERDQTIEGAIVNVQSGYAG